MEDSGPPCKRCAERGLSCVLNKSLQTLIEERGQWKHALNGDLEHMHAALQNVLSQMAMPSLPPLQTPGASVAHDSPQDITEREDVGPSCDNSPRLTPRDDALPQVPIDSLYQITRLRALRSDDNPSEVHLSPSTVSNLTVNDFISQGVLGIEDAERLVNLYLHRIDHFMYMIGGKTYRDLETMRRGSTILTAAVCTVAALHDPISNHLYGVCNREFRRLMSASIFDRRIDRDHLRAMCIASYWLHDVSWTLSGYAIRRANEINLSANYQLVLANHNEEAMDCMRIWYTLYICDHHLSILYGRESIIREDADASISGWEELMKSSAFTDSDKRMVSQVALLTIMSNIRSLFGPDIGEPIPRAFATQLTSFSRQIDQWMGLWTTELLKHHQLITEFPAKGVILHHHLAKLHLHSHIFRGLKGGPVPQYFHESAIAAVAAATAVVDLLLEDHDIREGLVGIPHYLHSMIAYACVFLLKVAAQYTAQYIDDALVLDMTSKVVNQFRATPVSKYHLVYLMADGLEKMASSKIKSPSTQRHFDLSNGMPPPNLQFVADGSTITPVGNGGGSAMYGDDMNSDFTEHFNLGTTPFLHFGSGNLDYTFGGFGQ
ncbi:hypothetical protein FB567DRAFT_554578 [Paraphoma chrysanthemicola]|uniref:Xylanolytic transcriptional activator regulatory domain-containing protein n=1 Tax=Paraphoma chrysanthemicola TaxID=798071 RepID=A0A8K0QUQ3_9PLEO|nr:hypothetical protein FB567DRAFT_554578 [Paraphoma chrysanthemicola]